MLSLFCIETLTLNFIRVNKVFFFSIATFLVTIATFLVTPNFSIATYLIKITSRICAGRNNVILL